MAATSERRLRRFVLMRRRDTSGISGIGRVAEGVEFSDGRVALRWVAHEQSRSTVLWDCIADLVTIHGHDGDTEVVWVDGW
jgi:hypothetical protein